MIAGAKPSEEPELTFEEAAELTRRRMEEGLSPTDVYKRQVLQGVVLQNGFDFSQRPVTLQLHNFVMPESVSSGKDTWIFSSASI